MKYNIINCAGFVDRMECGGAKLLIVLLFFVLAIIRKWVFELIGIEFSILIAEVIGIISYIIIVSLTGNLGLSFVVGLVLGIAGGYVGGMFFGGDGGG